jgi:hypothetical protein
LAPPGSGGIVAAVQGVGAGVAAVLAPPGSGGRVAAVQGGGAGAAAVLAPPGGRAAQDRAPAATAALQGQIAAGAAPTMAPTVISTGEAAQIRRGRVPDLNETVVSLNGLMDRARGMIETSIGGSRSVLESPNTKRQCVCTANIASLTGLLTVRGVLVTQGMSTTAVDAQTQDIIAEQANI